MKYLGIDYGKKKVGIALSEGLSASPYKVLEISGLVDALAQVKQIIRKEEIDTVVIGLAESGESKSMTEKFINELRAEEIDIIVVKETLSSHFADEQMRVNDVQKSKRAQNDALAAAFILEEYLDSQI